MSEKKQYEVNAQILGDTITQDGGGWERRTKIITWTVENDMAAAIRVVESLRGNSSFLRVWIEERAN